MAGSTSGDSMFGPYCWYCKLCKWLSYSLRVAYNESGYRSTWGWGGWGTRWGANGVPWSIWASASGWSISVVMGTSVASFLVWGGGHDLKCTDKNHVNVTQMRELAKRASALETYIFSSLKIHLHAYTINAVPFYYLWYGAIYKWQCTEKTLTFRKYICMLASGASELRKFSHFHN